MPDDYQPLDEALVRAVAEAVTPLFEAGRVLFPADAPWRSNLEDELASFPAAAHDDQVVLGNRLGGRDNRLGHRDRVAPR